MNIIIVDAKIARKLAAVSETAELCDRSGNVLGQFTPPLISEKQQSEEDFWSIIIVDAETVRKLALFTGTAELCDRSGKLLGQFSPLFIPEKYQLEPLISDEEMARRLKSNGRWYSTAEVLAYLEKL